jgi:serine/threonine protein kinase
MFSPFAPMGRSGRNVRVPGTNPGAQSLETPNGNSNRDFVATRRNIGRYCLLRSLHTDELVEFYEAYDPVLTRKVAIKVRHAAQPRPSDNAGQSTHTKLLEEAKSLAKLSHQNIVAVYDVGVERNGNIFMAMEFLSGSSLATHMVNHHRDWRVRLNWLLAAGAGLAFAHRSGILHRRISPDAIFICDDGSVRIRGFGFFDEDRRNLPQEAQGSATLHESDPLCGDSYLAPEVLSGQKPDPITEVYSFGATLLAALSLVPQAHRLTLSRGSGVHSRKWSQPIPMWLRQIVASTLHEDRDLRPQGIDDVLDSIHRGLLAERTKTRSTRFIAALALPVAMALSWSQWHTFEESVDSACTDPAPFIESTINPLKLADARRGFVATNLTLAHEVWAKAESSLHQWRDHWMNARANLCTAARNERGETALAELDRVQAHACLDEMKREVATLLQIWARPRIQQVLDATSVLDSLSDPRSCANLDQLRQRSPLPSDPEKRMWVLAQRSKLSEIRMRVESADYDGAQAILRSELPIVAERNDLELLAQFAFTLGEIQMLQGESLPANDDFPTRSLLLAIAANHSLPAIRAENRLWFNFAHASDDDEMNEEYRRSVAAKLIRGGQPIYGVSGYERSLAIIAAKKGDYREARRVLSTTQARLIGHTQRLELLRGRILGDLAENERYDRFLDDAVFHAQASGDIFKRLLPEGHPRRITSHAYLCETLIEKGAFHEALAQAYQGESECERAGSDHGECRRFKETIGDIHFQLGRYHDSISALEPERRERLTWPMPADQNARLLTYAIARTLAARGEVDTAVAIIGGEVQGLTNRELTFIPSAMEMIWMPFDFAIDRGDFDQARAMLDQLSDTSLLKPVAQELFGMRVEHARARLLLLKGETQAALHHLENLAHLGIASSFEPTFLSAIHFDLARAYLALGNFDRAKHWVDSARNLHFQMGAADTPAQARYDGFLAEIALAERRYFDALHELDHGLRVLDPVQVLDNVRAPLLFLAAQVWAQIDSSGEVQDHARALAQQAKTLFEQGPQASKHSVKSVEIWLKCIQRASNHGSTHSRNVDIAKCRSRE